MCQANHTPSVLQKWKCRKIHVLLQEWSQFQIFVSMLFGPSKLVAQFVKPLLNPPAKNFIESPGPMLMFHSLQDSNLSHRFHLGWVEWSINLLDGVELLTSFDWVWTVIDSGPLGEGLQESERMKENLQDGNLTQSC